MGLFGVHMPLLYGEGKNTFLRLQLEILKVSDDGTIFAWNQQTVFMSTETRETGLLAPWSSRFRLCGNTRQILFDAGQTCVLDD